MLRQVQRAIEPIPSLNDTLLVWPIIRNRLAERPRRREIQRQTIGVPAGLLLS